MPKQNKKLSRDPSMVLQCNTAVSTVYGDGKILSYREADKMYQVRLPFGTLYAVKESLIRRTPGVEVNAAFEALEKMRKLNLEVHCHELGVACDHEVCTTCLVESATPKEKKSSSSWMIPKLKSDKLKKGMPNCLICGNPTCPKHQSTGFKKQNIVLCIHCEKLFDLNFSSLLGLTRDDGEGNPANDSNQQHQQDNSKEIDTKLLEGKIREMVDTYDRVMLLLTHASQFIPDLGVRLVANEARNNRIGFGTSSAGVLSGALGLAGAATILTPFGAPLLMASLAISGSSAAMTIGNQTVNYYQRPTEAADRIIVLHGMVVSMLNAAKTLQNVAVGSDPSLQEEQDQQQVKKDENGKIIIGETVGQGLNIIRQTETGINLASAAATSSAAVSTAAPGATNLINTSASMLNAVPLLGTALSAIFIGMDANRMKATLAKINAGDPSEKADSLLNIQTDLLVFPQTVDLDLECQTFCEVIEKNIPSRAQ